MTIPRSVGSRCVLDYAGREIYRQIGSSFLRSRGFTATAACNENPCDPTKLIGSIVILLQGRNPLQGDHLAPRMRFHGYPIRDRVAM